MFIKKIPWLLLLVCTILIINFGLYKGCCLNVDSYHYADSKVLGYHDGLSFLVYNFGINVTQIILLVFHIATVCLLFHIIKKFYDDKIAFLTSMLYVIDPLVIFNTQLGLLDKNPITMFIMLGFFYAWCISSSLLKGIIISVVLWIMAVLFWDGAYYFLFMIMLIVTIWGILKKSKQYLVAGFVLTVSVGLLAFLLNKDLILGMLSDKGLVAETMYGFLLFSPMYIFYAFGLVLNYYKNNKLFLAGVLATLLPFLFMFRFLKFFLIFFYLSISILFLNKKYRKYLLMMFVFCAILSFPGYNRNVMHNDDMIKAVNYGNKDCLISNWGKGHIYRYYSDKNIMFSSAPRVQDLLNIMVYNNTDYINLTEYNMTSFNCSFLYTDEDIEYFDFIRGATFTEDTMYITTLPYVEFGKYKVVNLLE